MGQEQAAAADAAKPAERARRDKVILHVSDLHVGMRFDPDKWEELKHLAATIAPDLVAVTGDVVNSPWHWTLRRARARLQELRDAAAGARSGVELVCIPGNHDTRWQGILPLPWIGIFAAVCGVLCLLTLFLAGDPGATRRNLSAFDVGWREATLLTFAVLGLAALALRGCMSANLDKALAPFCLSEPRLLADGAIGVLPFDSASLGLSWARGFVRPRQMAAARKWVDLQMAGAEAPEHKPFFLALVHHHALPLPYDHEHEPMMVMDNAGEFLRQLAWSRVRLVLHGHKHHQHFARLAVDPASDARLEIAVLSAGTPTEGRGTLANRHGFNVLVVRPDHQVTVTRYESAGGPTFSALDPFDMVPADEHRRVRFEARRATAAAHCRRIVCVADITPYGDGFFTREYRGVQTSRDGLQRLPSAFAARSDAGVVEPYSVRSLSLEGPGVLFENRRAALNEVVGNICFKSTGLSPAYPPVDFQLSFLNNNAFALNAWQFSQMYPQRSDFTEDVQFGLNDDVAAQELVIHVHFPPQASLPSRVDACWFPAGEPQARRRVQGADIVRIETQNALQLTLQHPEQNVVYQLSWDVEDAVGQEAMDEGGAAEALALRRSLAKLAGQPSSDELSHVLANAMEEFRTVMKPEDGVGLEGTLLAYDEEAQRLVGVCSTQGSDPPPHSYGFGLGIAGRAFKSGEALSFVPPANAEEICGTGYLRPDGTLPDRLADIPEQGIVCIPLSPEDAPDWPFGVLQVSWKVPSRSLVRSIYQGHQAALQQAYALAMPILLRDILLFNLPDAEDRLP